MEKQHNRGQDGAGVASVKLDVDPGKKYISRFRSNSNQPIKDLFSWIWENFDKVKEENPALLKDPVWLKNNLSFTGELLMGHLRYGTHGGNHIDKCHPFIRQNNWKTRSLVVAGNFNMTNASELFDQLVEIGQHPKEDSDTVTVLEKIGHFVDTENQRIFDEFKPQGYSNKEMTDIISRRIDLKRVLKRVAKDFDGGYCMMGFIGHGDVFALRDPNGIRPAYYYLDDEVAVLASERPAIQTTFDVPLSKVKELDPGHALIIRSDGTTRLEKCREPEQRLSCSFERIYFSRGTDKDIYKERKKLGELLAPAVLESINYDLDNTVTSFIPNTAETSFYGLVKGLETWQNNEKTTQILKGGLSTDEINTLLAKRPRVEKVAVKDAKLRTFITEDSARDELVSHVYDITYGSVKPNDDNLVIIDDSIVRGTTLEKSILSILDRLRPKKIVVVSSAPQIRYPDCYGIDMSKLGEFIAFRAAISLIKERFDDTYLREIYLDCLDQNKLPAKEVRNQVKRVYEPFTDEEISARISEIVRPKHIFSEVQVIYQSIENLHKACPNHTGDWYFSGNYPTPGGNKVVNKAFINFYEGNKGRAY